MEKRATMHDVADLAGVSQATVSLVLNGVPNARVSKATRRRVQDAADKLGYRRGKTHPVPAGRQRVIGLFIDEVSTTPFAAPLIEGARDEAALQDVTVATFCTGNNPALEQAGLDMLVAGDIPQGSGLSSSASLSVASGMALGGLFAPGRFDATQIALIAQRAECDFVGMRCGNMDQLASAHGVAGHALLVDCRSLDVRPVAMPPDTAVLIVHSGISRGLVDGHYNERRAQCEAVARQLGAAALRDVTPGQLEAARADLDPVAYRRARHVVTENVRTLDAAAAMEWGDLMALGNAMAESHASMQGDFEITLPAIDRLVAELQDAIGGHGGARMTGGGFGGAVVALVEADAVEAVVARVEARYRTPEGGKPLIMVECAHAGASFL